jgi:EAL and modified HD-GYP domain-containing signal transduction protein
MLGNIDKFKQAGITLVAERDVSLSYKLLRFINNPLANKSNKVNNLRHALS